MQEDRDNQIRRTARVLEIIQQIATSPYYWTRKKLAGHHEISERMIQKDLEIIRVRLDLPLNNERMGYSFSHLPHLPSTVFSFAEAIAILSAARAAQVLPGVNSAELAVAITRLESVFPEQIRGLLKESLDRLPRSSSKTHRQTMLLLFNRAYYERKQICIQYLTQNQAQAKERIVEPYAILPYGRSWFLVAYDHYREAVLQFKLDRVLSAKLLEVSYQIPQEFNLDEYLGDGWGMMRGAAGQAEEVCLVFDETAGRWVSEEIWHKSQQIQQLSDGRFDVCFLVGITPEMINWLLYYGSHVQVIKPEWLRDKVREEHRLAWERMVHNEQAK
ncbi:MAG: WYL domain-containing protein [Anaerolineaceae bacterium]|nr:WYL domain-containing protein [Anaerolineaceae bacterium]